MRSRANYTLVGLFVVALTTALIAGVLWLSSGRVGQSYDEYVVYMQESVSGLSRDSTVKYYGVDVGRVRRIELGATGEDRVRLLLQVDAGTPVRRDTFATLEVQGLTGLAYINLFGGSEDAPLLEAAPGEAHPVIPSRPSIWGRLDTSLGELVDNVTEASRRLNELLNDDNRRAVSETLDHLEELSRTLARRSETLGTMIDDAAVTLGAAREAGERLPGLVVQLEDTAAAMETMAVEVGEAGTAVRRTAEAGGRDLRGFTAAVLSEIEVLAQELQAAARNFRRFSEELERDPGVLLRGTPRGRPGPGE